MNRTGVAILVLEVAATAAVQSTGMAGLVPFSAAALIVVLTAVFLALRSPTPSLGDRLRDFVSQRRADAPADDIDGARRDYELDILECYRRTLGPAVRKRVRGLRQRGHIGSREERRLTHPSSLNDLELVAERLIDLDGRGV